MNMKSSKKFSLRALSGRICPLGLVLLLLFPGIVSSQEVVAPPLQAKVFQTYGLGGPPRKENKVFSFDVAYFTVELPCPSPEKSAIDLRCNIDVAVSPGRTASILRDGKLDIVTYNGNSIFVHLVVLVSLELKERECDFLFSFREKDGDYSAEGKARMTVCKKDEFGIRNLIFCNLYSDKTNYMVSPVLCAERVYFRCCIGGLTEDENKHKKVGIDLSLRDVNGVQRTLLSVGDPGSILDRPSSDFDSNPFLYFTHTLQTYQPGRYLLHVRAKDMNSEKVVEEEVPILVVDPIRIYEEFAPVPAQ